MYRLSYKIMLLITILATIGGLLTIIPYSGASYPNIIGYKSLCTFAPAATFFCFSIAGVSCFIRSTFIKDQSGLRRERFKRHSNKLLIVFVLICCATFFTYKYNIIKAPYLDGTTSASYEN
ncbi:MAG: hypothetical protein JXR64_03745 [Spirochaetales bacterium]|nr:hypothetical protein [Spirochaetales bacterium]